MAQKDAFLAQTDLSLRMMVGLKGSLKIKLQLRRNDVCTGKGLSDYTRT